jgi:N-acetylglucosaminyldiphosphoundecaprenol N-acetyl-beta-D-mannosaminyltransferase
MEAAAPGTVAAGPAHARILGVPLNPVGKGDAVRAIVDRAEAAPPGAFVCLTNVHTTVEAQSSPQLRSALEAAFLSVPDGMPLVWILRRRGHRTTEKITGIELVPLVASAGSDRGLRHFLYGGAPGVADRAARRIRELVSGANVVGTMSPPFASAGALNLDELRHELETTKPHILWVGLGAPKQELWMASAANELDVPVMIGVGAAFDYLAGTKPAAPAYLRHIGLEWLFRLAVEPRRLWRRYLVGNLRFVQLLVAERRRSSDEGVG